MADDAGEPVRVKAAADRPVGGGTPDSPRGGVSARRQAYLDVLAAAVDLVRTEEVADRWDEPSILDGMTVGAVVVHGVLGTATSIRDCVEGPTPPGSRAFPAERLFVGVPLDPADDVHLG